MCTLTFGLAQGFANSFDAEIIRLRVTLGDSARRQHKRIALSQRADLRLVDRMREQSQRNTVRSQQDDVGIIDDESRHMSRIHAGQSTDGRGVAAKECWSASRTT